MNTRFLTLISFLALALGKLQAADPAYSIQVSISGFSQKEIYLGYYLGDKQYLRDTAVADAKGLYTFEGAELLPAGVYIVVLPPDNNFFQILIPEKEQKFSVQTSLDNMSENVVFKGSTENTTFYKYLSFLSVKNKEADPINKAIEEAKDETAKAELRKKLEAIGEDVKSYQAKFVKENGNMLAARIVAANLSPEFPEFQGTDEEKQVKMLYFLRSHYFDYLNLADPSLLRTPFLFEKIDYYVNKLHYQHPDSLAVAIDTVLERLRPADESFRFYLVHFLNAYAKSNFVGMDAVYVHIAEKYYAAGDAPWIETEQLNKIIENAKSLKPILIGKTAPDIEMQKRDGSKIKLSAVKSPYTILYFWRYDCGHCKEQTPIVKEFYEKFKDKGVKIFAVCVKFRDEIADCWKYIDENGIGDWIHTVDPYLASRYYTLYNVKTTPQVFILDANKKILSKNISGEQLESVLNQIMEMDKAEKEGKE